MNDLNSIAIIPARGGSKRIPKKNIRKFLGSPLIKYSIEAALKSKCFNEIMVSTDDREIAKVAKRYGAKVPFMRNKKTARDRSILVDVALEVLGKYKKLGRSFDLVCIILPTAPLLQAKLIEQGMKMLCDDSIEEALPVVAFSYPIQRAFKLKAKRLKMLNQRFMNINSQNLETAYHDAGQFYWLKADAFLKQRKMFLNKIIPIILPESEVQDIDVEEDLKMAELKYKLFNNLN